jgi:uncharacterized membrane protein
MPYKLNHYAKTVSTNIRCSLERVLIEIFIGAIAVSFGIYALDMGMIVGALASFIVGIACVIAVIGSVFIYVSDSMKVKD